MSGRRIDIDPPVSIVSETFGANPPELRGWFHRYGQWFGIIWKGYYVLCAADWTGHAQGWRDPCSQVLIDVEPHIEVFDETCPGFKRRTPMPAGMAALAAQPVEGLKQFLAMFTLEWNVIEQAPSIARQLRLDEL